MPHLLKCHAISKTDFTHGKGCWLYDSQGRRYLDCEAGIWCTALGHSHPRINQAIHQQIELVAHLGTRYPNQVVEEAAVAVLDTLDLLEGRCVFLSSGSEAVEFAVQAARQITGKPLLLTLADSFLGSYGSAGKKRADEWHCLDWRACADCPGGEDCNPGCEMLQSIPFDQIGAFVLEPGSASGWVRFPPRGLVQTLAERVRANGGLVVVNEITTGIGRTGLWYGFQHYGLRPDLVAIGKGLGNGYPVSCAAMTSQVARRLEESPFRYSQSHQNDPLGCAVAREVIAVLREEDLIERSSRVGAAFQAGLQALSARQPAMQAVRGHGLMLAFDLDPDHGNLSANWLYQSMLERGFLVGISSKSAAPNFVRFDPALIVGQSEIACLLENLEQVLDEHKLNEINSNPRGDNQWQNKLVRLP